MARLNTERQEKLEPKRVEYAKKKIEALGFEVFTPNETQLTFIFNGNTIQLFPYSGWHSGKGITDGRGLEKLLKQIGS